MFKEIEDTPLVWEFTKALNRAIFSLDELFTDNLQSETKEVPFNLDGVETSDFKINITETYLSIDGGTLSSYP